MRYKQSMYVFALPRTRRSILHRRAAIAEVNKNDPLNHAKSHERKFSVLVRVISWIDSDGFRKWLYKRKKTLAAKTSNSNFVVSSGAFQTPEGETI